MTRLALVLLGAIVAVPALLILYDTFFQGEVRRRFEGLLGETGKKYRIHLRLADGRLVPMASTGTPPTSWSDLESAASLAMNKGTPTTTTGADGRFVIVGVVPGSELTVTARPANCLGGDVLLLVAAVALPGALLGFAFRRRTPTLLLILSVAGGR